MPTTDEADHLQMVWHTSSTILVNRLLVLDDIADDLALLSCRMSTVRDFESFIWYLADQRQFASLRYDREHRLAWHASGFHC